MNWIVGMDLRPHGSGALHFASWLAKTSRAPGGERFIPVHVLEDEHLRFVLRFHHLDDVERSARAAARAALVQVELPTAGPEIVVGGRAEEGLVAACRSAGGHGIIVGRIAKREPHGLVRLGRVARRLLRKLPVPVIVVPPDLHHAGIGSGPVVALTALDEGVSACAFAGDIARRIGRDLAIVHVVPPPEDVAYVLRATLEQVARERRTEAERKLEEWVRSNELAPATARVLAGDLFEAALAFAREQAAPLLVLGARGTAAHAPRWGPSISRDVAANAPLAVAVVPEPA